MKRSDTGLAFLLQYEHIAWYEDAVVKILDRRVYPQKISYCICTHHKEVAQAIADMVTQSAGPYTAAAMGMALAAYECRNLDEKRIIAYLQDAAYTLSHARPTTTERMSRICEGCIQEAKRALAHALPVSESIVAYAIAMNNERYDKIAVMASFLVDMIPFRGKVLTHCFGETIVGFMVKEAQKRGNPIEVYCSETRPYFQGARLTASVVCDMGTPVTVITDNMGAYAIQQEQIDLFTSAADVICLDGHIVNKVGTFQLAIVAHHLKIPYFVTGAPDKNHQSIDSVTIEMRDPHYSLEAMGTPTAMEGVKGYYPAFDITPPHLVSGIITDNGIYSPYDVHRYYKTGNKGEF